MMRMIRLAAILMTAALLATACGQAAPSSGAAGQGGAQEADESADQEADQSADAEAAEPAESDAGLEDGLYVANFETDSSMFHINEADDGKGILTVKNGEMTIYIRMPSKNIVNLYAGLKEDAQKEGAKLIQPVVDKVLYEDGTTGEVNAFNVPVPAIDEEFDVAIIGTHGNWYDHKVKVTDPVRQEG